MKHLHLPSLRKPLKQPIPLNTQVLSTLSKATLLIIVFFSLVTKAVAQYETDTPTTESDSAYDYYDENIDMGDYGDFSEGSSSEEEEPKKPQRKPYVRIKMPVDSITEMITYDSVFIQDESYYDSLYLRAKRFVNERWFKGEKPKSLAKIYLEDQEYEKFKVKLTLPLRVRYNKYASDEYGEIEFILTMRFKDGKYKFTATNFVHQLPETSNKKDINYVYMEFYMKSERNVVTYDRYLRATDFAIRGVMKDMTKAMREPVEIDEDDW